MEKIKQTKEEEKRPEEVRFIPKTNLSMIKIKQTKSIEMWGNENKIDIFIGGSTEALGIPMKSVFQVKRGLESYIQKFYRKQIKK